MQGMVIASKGAKIEPFIHKTDEEIDKITEYITRNRPGERPKPFMYKRFGTDAGKGEEIYKLRCALCHGEKGKGGKRLLGMNLVFKDSDPEFLAMTVRDGRKETPMVAFGKKGVGLKDQEISDVVSYLMKLSQNK